MVRNNNQKPIKYNKRLIALLPVTIAVVLGLLATSGYFAQSAPITENDLMNVPGVRPEVQMSHLDANQAVGIPLTELVSNSNSYRVDYNEKGLPTFIHDDGKVQITLYKGTKSGTDSVIVATVKNIGTATIYAGPITIEGMVPIPSGAAGYVSVLQASSNIPTISDATLKPGDSITTYIVGNWSVLGKPINGFAAVAQYSYSYSTDPEVRTVGYTINTPIEWTQ